MVRISSRWLVLPAAAVAVAAILTADPVAEKTTGRGEIDLPPDIAAARKTLEEREAVVLNRSTYKEALIQNLIDGRITLDQTVDEFLRVNLQDSQVVYMIRVRYQGSGDEEKTAYNVLDYVRGRAPKGEAGVRLMERLEADFAARFGHPPRASYRLP